ncbi:hypothetical protein [Acidaminococcus massiliensis]|jgi:hypothetical protein|uniref:hypothetical protein n=1 Tax=Acidaminococcus massiliensis TaxID=1852375 RepID=UPI0020631A52|nr:hypothetical protein [Acidaminococcus massiliensis]DAJ46520.1 MAG TPA: AAA domain protein [Caudoviricetes sp.]
MGMPVFVIGFSGSGKSSSLRNFKPNEVGVFSVAGKRLPFQSELKVAMNSNYQTIENALQRNKLRAYVIDDSQYLLAFDSFRRAKEASYTKFTDYAVSFYNLLDAIKRTSPDTIVYLLHHAEETDRGMIKAKTIGKMLDNQLVLEGLCEIVLYAETDGKKYQFLTQSNGFTTAKSPMGMFPLEIDNDLKAVDSQIRKFYNMEPIVDKEEEKK